jgi:cupin fold WbuC family metalloprotein
MSSIKEIKVDDKIFAIHIPSTSWIKGLNFYSNDNDFIQVGTWGYDSGKKLQPHIHNEIKREINRTQEVVYVKSGKLTTFIYTEDGKLIEKIELNQGDVFIALGGGHGYEILEDNTFVLEIKNGPYPGAENDRRRIEWAMK